MSTHMTLDKQTFLANHPAYGYNGTIDEIYQNEFLSRLPTDRVYLDHAGTTLYTQSQLDAHFRQLRTSFLNNPHSEQEDSKTLLLIQECIESILSIFETSSRDYSIVFTLNTTHACQLLSTLFPFSSKSEYAYMIDSHNSLIGIRQQAKLHGGSFSVIDYPSFIYNQRTNSDSHESFHCVGHSPPDSESTSTSISYCLFACPAENNFNGLRPPLNELVRPFITARDASSSEFPIPVKNQPSKSCRWLTLVDCAKYLSTKPFSLKSYPVDFVVLSFYKIFGYPTGLGALIIRNDVLKILNKEHYFGGGSVEYVSPYDETRVDYKSNINGFIHGTIPFTSILSVYHGFQLITSQLTYKSISLHTQCLIDYCRNEMSRLAYSNGQKLCLFYDARGDLTRDCGYSYGPILNFNLYNKHGQFLSCRLIQRIASDHNITLRVGTFCAPGASQSYLGSRRSLETNHECCRGLFCGTNHDGEDVIDFGRQPLGSIRVSLGWMSRYEDIQIWIDFLCQIVLQGIGIAPLFPPSVENGNLLTENLNLTLTHIYIYPIKSCAPMSVTEWPLTSIAFLYDREWMIVDQNMNPLTLKRLPSLSQIKPHIDLKQKQLILSASNHPSFIIDIHRDSAIVKSSVQLKDRALCNVYSGEIEQWLTRVLGIYATLARRTIDSQMTLANEGAFLLVHEESVRQIKSELTDYENITHERFRPNLVVDGQSPKQVCPAYSEDLWKRMLIFHENQIIRLETSGLCQRCSAVNVDPSTGKNQSHLFTRLQTQRREANTLRANFGILLNLSEIYPHALIRVGDSIQAFT
ncbi:unnamed protein product [Adineta ricciae]|uniref:MOSC domain-containing protein n=1 Tax=Adineta ricciae TaxID=249248 RepID=A0A814BEF7_ADIRI|nr:unnamed protein product [Adineta ricciae]CAF0925759.1 unnamed protein product [Adineta ricciae]